jgi:hypothetical protein
LVSEPSTIAGKEIKIEVVEKMKIIAKQLENLKRQWEEDQVLLAGLEQHFTALEQWLPAMPRRQSPRVQQPPTTPSASSWCGYSPRQKGCRLQP